MENEEEEETFLECEVCKLLFSGVEPYTQHIQGSKHRKKEAKLKMKKERRNQNPSGGQDESETLDDSTLQDSDSEDEEITCSICDKKFSGPVSYNQHIKSSPHRKAERRQKLREKLQQNISDEIKDVEITADDEKGGILPTPFAICKVCHKDFSGPESFQQHLESKPHQRKLVEGKLLDILKKHGMIDSEESTSANEPDDKENQSDDNVASAESRDEQIIQELEKSIFQSENLDNKEISEMNFSCEGCEKNFSGPVPYAQHLISESHRKKLKQIRLLKELETAKENEEDEESSDEDQEDVVLTCDVCKMAFSGPESMVAHMKSRKHLNKVKLHKLRKQIKSQKNVLISKYSRKSNEKHGEEDVHSVEKAKSEGQPSGSKVPVDVESSESSGEGVPAKHLPITDDDKQLEETVVDAPFSEISNMEASSENKSIQTDTKKSVLKKIAKAVKVGVDEL